MSERIVIRDERRERFVRIPLKLFLDARIKDEHICTYGALATFADYRDGSCRPSMEGISRRAKVGPRRVRRALRDFEKWGDYVRVEWSRGGVTSEDGRGLCHVFTLLDVPAMTNPVQTARVQPSPIGPCSNGQGNETREDSGKRKEKETPSPSTAGPTSGRKHDPEVYQIAKSITLEVRKDLADLYEGKGPDPDSFGRDLSMIVRMIKHYGADDTRSMIRAGMRWREEHGRPISVPALFAVRDRLFHEVVKAREKAPRPYAGVSGSRPVRSLGPRNGS